eukprot:scaffold44591_cov54-Attheya_sp.AAC.7
MPVAMIARRSLADIVSRCPTRVHQYHEILRDIPIYFNAPVISVLYPNLMTRTLGSASARSLGLGMNHP